MGAGSPEPEFPLGHAVKITPALGGHWEGQVIDWQEGSIYATVRCVVPNERGTLLPGADYLVLKRFIECDEPPPRKRGLTRMLTSLLKRAVPKGG
jgi:hypothetical protein